MGTGTFRWASRSSWLSASMLFRRGCLTPAMSVRLFVWADAVRVSVFLYISSKNVYTYTKCGKFSYRTQGRSRSLFKIIDILFSFRYLF